MGSYESFGQAAKRFKEHYGWTVERGGIRREVEAIALWAESFVEKRLLALETKFKNLIPPKRRSGWNRILVELDGCQSVHYKRYREWGLPIGSGEIESSHRYIPQKAERPRRGLLGVRTHQARLKIPGATWHPQTINPMLALRVIRANNWWSDFWETSTLRRNCRAA